MVSMTRDLREWTIGAPLSPTLRMRRGVSPFSLASQGSSLPNGGFNALERGRKIYGLTSIHRIDRIAPSRVAAPASTKGPLSGVPAWSPPVL